MATYGEASKPSRRPARWVYGLMLAACVWAVAQRSAIADPIPTDPQGPANLAEADQNPPEVKQALELFQKGDFKGAYEAIEAATKAHPELPPAKVIMANIWYSANQPQRGRILLEQAAQEDPKNPSALISMGRLALNESRVFEAGMLYEKALELANQFEGDAKAKKDMILGCTMGRAAAAEGAGNWDQAKTLLEEWLKLDDKSVQARQRLGRAQFEIGFRDKSKDMITNAYNQFVANADQSEEVLPPGVTMGQLYESKDDRKQAQTWMDYALKDPKWGKDPRTVAGVGRWYLDTDRPAEAQKLFAQAVESKPDNADYKKLLGVTYRFLKQYPEAEKLFEDIYGKTPSDATAINQLALVLIEQPDKVKQDRALQLAEMNARQFAKAPEYQATLGYVYDKLGRADDAKRRYGLSLEANQRRPFPDLAYYMAIVQNREGRYDAAKQLLDGVLTGQQQPFVYKEQATKLLAEVAPKATGAPAATPVSNTPNPASTPAPTTGATP